MTELPCDRCDVLIEGSYALVYRGPEPSDEPDPDRVERLAEGGRRRRGCSEEGARGVAKGLLRRFAGERSLAALVVCDECAADLQGRS